MVHFYVRPSLVSSLVLVLILFDASSYATKVVEVNTICNRTTNPSFCSNILNSRPGGAIGAELVTLAQYTIDVVRANVTNTINLIKSLIANASDPNAKDHYNTCLTHFSYNEGALGEVEYTAQMLKTRDCQGVNVAAAGIASNVEYCISGDSPSDPPYYDPSVLPRYANFVEQAAEIICVISTYLMHS